jgi:hypothetical protein
VPETPEEVRDDTHKGRRESVSASRFAMGTGQRRTPAILDPTGASVGDEAKHQEC